MPDEHSGGRTPRGLGGAAAEAFVKAMESSLDEPISERIAAIDVEANEVGFDPFGFDPETSRVALAGAAYLHRRYFRTEVHGIERVPEGRVLLIANHAGQLPLDGVMIATSMLQSSSTQQ